MNPKIVQKELSYQIVNVANEIHKQLGPGFLESIYEAAMVLELEARGHKIETQVRFPVYYREQKIGELVIDVLVNEKGHFKTQSSDENTAHSPTACALLPESHGFGISNRNQFSLFQCKIRTCG